MLALGKSSRNVNDGRHTGDLEKVPDIKPLIKNQARNRFIIVQSSVGFVGIIKKNRQKIVENNHSTNPTVTLLR